MMKRLTLALILLFALFSTASATNYYMNPLGNDANDGLTGALGRAWQSLQRAKSTLVAGDTLFIMGGSYNTQQYWSSTCNSGTAAHPIVLKAWGDSEAVFKVGSVFNGSEYFIFFFYGSVSGGHIILDGESHLSPGPTKFIRFTAPCTGLYRVEPDAGYHWRGMVIRGCVFDGTLSNDDGAGHHRGAYPVIFANADSFEIDNCTIKKAWHATGSTGGDGSDGDQGTGDCLFIKSCYYGKITDDSLMYGNHGLICIQPFYYQSGHTSKYITISGCTLDNGWGGGIFCTMNSQYCLIENNTFKNFGVTCTTTKDKPAIELGGSYNTVRKNVIYNPSSQGFRMEAQGDVDGAGMICTRNFIYNNTIFKSEGANIGIYVSNADFAYCKAEYNYFYNNLLYKSDHSPWMEGVENSGTTYGGYRMNLWLNVNNASGTTCWNIPYQAYPYVSPVTTHWGHNKFWNNLLRLDSRGAAIDTMILFGHPGGAASSHWSLYLGQAQRAPFTSAWVTGGRWGDGPGGDTLAFYHNVGGDPLLASESPDAYGWSSTHGWWFLQPGSAAIDSGVAVIDSNGIWMRANAAGYAWDDLTYSGAAPDIGAYEVTGAEDTCAITVTRPTAAPLDEWTEGTVHNITWTHASTAANVRITLYKLTQYPENEPEWGETCRYGECWTPWHVITASTSAAAGTYAWTVGGNSGDNGYSYGVKVTNLGAGGDTTCSNMSDPFFIIPLPVCTMSVTSPTIGVSWIVGSSHAVTWTSTNGGTYSKLELYKAGVFEGTISSSSANATGSYAWTVEKFGAADGADYTVVATDLTYPTCKDTSAAFSIVGVTSCGVSVSSLSFGNIATGDSTATQSFTITNTGDITLTGYVYSSTSDFDVITGGGAYTLTTHQVKTVTVRFQPQTGGAKTAFIETGVASCSHVTITGGALTVSPASIAFSSTNVGECSDPSTITITNNGSGTITGTIFEACGDFEIVSGGGAYSLTTGASRVIYVKFCPLSGGTKTCSINY